MASAQQHADPNDVNTDLGATAYAYDPTPGCGIKVRSGTPGNMTNLLIDPAGGHTGYAQVLEEKVDNALARTYTLGDDVLTQAGPGVNPPVHHLLYDGHGSTRLLTDNAATPAVTANYNFDAYGNALGFDPASATTNLLYAGEYLASAAGQYYLRARHYDTANGRFNRVDPFGGNIQDPQSLHKYAYAHSNPVMNIDPSGNFTLVEIILVVVAIVFVATAIFSLRSAMKSRALRAERQKKVDQAIADAKDLVDYAIYRINRNNYQDQVEHKKCRSMYLSKYPNKHLTSVNPDDTILTVLLVSLLCTLHLYRGCVWTTPAGLRIGLS